MNHSFHHSTSTSSSRRLVALTGLVTDLPMQRMAAYIKRAAPSVIEILTGLPSYESDHNVGIKISSPDLQASHRPPSELLVPLLILVLLCYPSSQQKPFLSDLNRPYPKVLDPASLTYRLS